MAATESKEEYVKAFFEYLKHLTTLSTGSIVLIAAFLEKLFQKPLWKALIVISLSGFMLSVISSVLAYTVFLLFEFPLPTRKTGTPNWAQNIGTIGILLTWSGFLVGILSLAVFAIKNFLQ